jgi:hypothetical protein
MRNFYAAHVREPMFPAMTRIGLMFTERSGRGRERHVDRIWPACSRRHVRTRALVANADSRVGSRVDAGYRLQRRSIGANRAVGATSSLPFSTISCAWAWLRFSRLPTRANAVLAGALSGGACLTRITTIALIAPAVVWLLMTRGASIRRELSIAIGVMTVLVAPFWINCAIATGDPFYAINNHI